VTARIVVLGGSGFFGRYLAEDLLARTDADIVVASRHATRREGRVQRSVCDVFDRESLRRALEGAPWSCTAPAPL